MSQVAYKSQDKTVLNDYKEYVKETLPLDEAKKAYDYYYRKLYIDDLNTYLRIKTGEDIEVGYGNYNSSVVFVLSSMTNKHQIEFLKAMFAKLNMDFNNFYFTSFYKTNTPAIPFCEEVVGLELKALKPKIVLSIGEFGIKPDGFELVTIDINLMDFVVKADASTMTPEEQKDLTAKKLTLWKQLNTFVKYYSV